MIRPRGCNASGHRGWYELKCRICAKKLYVGDDVIYHCPKCAKKYEAYFCVADVKKLGRRCPYCNADLVTLISLE